MEYCIKETLHSRMQSYFAKSLEARLRSTQRQRSRWLQLVQLAASHPSTAGPRQTMHPQFFRVESESRTDAPRTGTVNQRTVPVVPAILQQGRERPT